MNQKNRNPAEHQDEDIIHLFTNLGMPKNLAKTLLYISHVDTCRSQDIEQAAELLQPQVSLAIQELKKKGWVKKHDKKKKGKGRPVHHYYLTKSLPEILKSFQNEKQQEIETIKKNFSELEVLLKETSTKH